MEATMDAEQNRREEYLIYSKVFRRNALLLIDKMVKMASDIKQDTSKQVDKVCSELVDEILHSIFFLGEINCPVFSPKKLVGDIDIFNSLKEAYPEPFRLYSSQLPRRSPFSCVLDMVVHLKGQENEEEIRTKLQEVVRELRENPSNKAPYATVCVSHDNNTDTLVYLKEQEDENKIRRILQELVKKLMGQASDTKLYSTKISVSCGNSTPSNVPLEGHANEDEIITKLQELVTGGVSYSTICVSRGNSTVSVVFLKGQVSEDTIRTKLQEVIKKFMDNASNKALYVTICVSCGNNKVSEFDLKGQEDQVTKLQELVKKWIENASNEALYFTICASYVNNTDKLVYLKEQEDQDKIRTKLQEPVKKLMNNISDTKLYSTAISVSHGNNTPSDVPLEGQESVDEIITKLQDLIRTFRGNPNEASYSTICISRGNSTVSVVLLKEQDAEIRTKLEKVIKKLMENASKKALYSTICASRGDIIISVVLLKRQENQGGINQTSQRLVRELMGNYPNTALYSTTICVSHTQNKHSVKHYGVSMSTVGDPARQILIGASCLSYWEEHVADAVMSYYPEKTRKKYFDVTIKLPDDVRCQAFDLTENGKEKNPCRSCSNMFGLRSDTKRENLYGNCAEAESLSKLLREEIVGVQIIKNSGEVNKERARNYVTDHLRSELVNKRFKWDIPFYPAP